MLSIPATGLLNASPAVKTQQPQRKYDSMPALKRVNNDTTSFKWNVQKEANKLVNGGNYEGFISTVETTFYKDNKAKASAIRQVLGKIKKEADDVVISGLNDALNRLESKA